MEMYKSAFEKLAAQREDLEQLIKLIEKDR